MKNIDFINMLSCQPCSEFPAFENERSEEAEVAGIAKYLAAKLYNSGNCDLIWYESFLAFLVALLVSSLCSIGMLDNCSVHDLDNTVLILPLPATWSRKALRQDTWLPFLANFFVLPLFSQDKRACAAHTHKAAC